MDELNGDRAFADSGSDAFHRTMAHITHGEKAGDVRFEQEGISVERPAFGALPVAYEVGPSQNEPAVVALDDSREPVGSWERSNKNEHRSRRHTLELARIRTKERNLFQMCFAVGLRLRWR